MEDMQPARVAINGFGRIGRLFFRQVFASPAEASAKAGLGAGWFFVGKYDII
jgi:hypothetical protein